MKPIYLDYNGTTPIAPEVADEMRKYLDECFGNPSSSHFYGEQAKDDLKLARKRVAELINCEPYEIIFTSGGTESNNHAIRGVAWKNQEKGKHIVSSAVEHPAVTEVLGYLQDCGFAFTKVPVDKFGIVNPADIERAITPETTLITVMHSNNEIGAIQPIKEISTIAKKHGIVFHTDASQSIGKVSVDVQDLGCDLLTIAGHKVYAPKGVGALFIRRGLKLQNLMFGAGQERGIRPGTENMLEIVGLGKACEIAKNDFVENIQHIRTMRDRLHQGLQDKVFDFIVNGNLTQNLPNTLNVSIKGIDADTALALMDEHLSASAGAACHADSITVSSTISAIGVPREYARGTMRFTTGKYTTAAEIDRAITLISQTIKKLRG
ncbi:MAG: cysteine desulfurase [Planctomycetes bacterium]|nr:cysteine desulfurase [Planctomycetota bacterium]